MSTIYANEQWWQENGHAWVKEIEKRRNTQPLYGIQEIVLSDYFSHIPKGSKVLEFGAGFGRHAKYLKEIDDLEYFAVDQSPTMKLAYEQYTGSLDNYFVIEPRDRLPFPDNYFNVVFTVSVLIHINPEHIQNILRELQRVAKNVVLHFENKYVEHAQLAYQDHGGCWMHCIPELYNLPVNIYNELSEEQDLYTVQLNPNSDYLFDMSATEMGRLKVAGSYLKKGLDTFEGEVKWRQERLEKVEEENRTFQEELKRCKECLEKVEEENRINQGEIKRYQELLKVAKDELKSVGSENVLFRKSLIQYKDLVNESENRVALLESKEKEFNNYINTLNCELAAIKNCCSFRLLQKLWNNRMLVALWKTVKKISK